MADSSIQELTIRYKADIEDLQAKVTQIENTLRKAEGAATSAGEKTKTAFKDVGNTAGDSLRKVGSAIVAAFAVEQIIAFGKESEKAFLEAERSAQKLRSAVSVRGGLQNDFDSLLTQSKELQDITIFSDETVQDAQTAALQFGLAGDEVKKIIPLVADFASATGQDLKTALDGVLRGIEGQGRGLKVYGINLKEGASRAQKFDSIISQLTSKFNGQAESIAKTSGQAEIYKNKLNDMEEAIGSKVSPALVSLRALFLDAASAGTDFLLDVGKAFDFIFRTGSAEPEAINSVEKLTVAIQSAKKEFDTLNLTQGEAEERIDNISARRRELLEKTKTETGIQLELDNQQLFALTAQELALRQIAVQRKSDAVNSKASFVIEKATTEELKQRLSFLESQTDFRAKDEIEQINKILEARKKADEEAIKSKTEASAKLAELESKLQQGFSKEVADGPISKLNAEQKIAEDEAKFLFNLSLKRKQDEEKLSASLLIIQKTFNQKRIEAEQEANAKIEKSRKDLQENLAAADIEQREVEIKIKLNDINTETQQAITDLESAFGNIADFSTGAEQKLQSDILNLELNGLKQQEDALRNSGKETIDIEKQVAEKEREIIQLRIQQQRTLKDKIVALEKELRDAVISGTEQIITNSINVQAEAELKKIESTRNAEVSAIDASIADNQQKAKSNIIGASKAAIIEKQLLEEKKKAEEQAAEKIREIKRKQFVSDQIASAAKIEIAALVASAEAGFNPALTALYEGLALAQIAVVISEPNPYKRGSKSTDEGLSLVGEEGPELLMLPRRAKVLPTTKTQNPSNASLIDAMFDGRVDEYIQQMYVEPNIKMKMKGVEGMIDYPALNNMLLSLQITPELKAANNTYKIKKEENLAMNIANAFYQKENDGLTMHQQRKLNKAGVRLANAKDIAVHIGKEVSKEVGKALEENNSNGRRYK